MLYVIPFFRLCNRALRKFFWGFKHSEQNSKYSLLTLYIVFDPEQILMCPPGDSDNFRGKFLSFIAVLWLYCLDFDVFNVMNKFSALFYVDM